MVEVAPHRCLKALKLLDKKPMAFKKRSPMENRASPKLRANLMLKATSWALCALAFARPVYANSKINQTGLILQAAKIVEGTRSQFPPEKSFILYIGAGNVLEAEIQAQRGPNDGTYFRHIPVMDLVRLGEHSDTMRDEFFKAILPSKEILRGRQLVLSRNLFASVTMEVFIPALLEYMQKNGYGDKISVDFKTMGPSETKIFEDAMNMHMLRPHFEEIYLREYPNYVERIVKKKVVGVSAPDDIQEFGRFKQVSAKSFIEGQIAAQISQPNPKSETLERAVRAFLAHPTDKVQGCASYLQALGEALP